MAEVRKCTKLPTSTNAFIKRVGEVPPVDPAVIRTGPRVGVAAAHHTPWRFWIAGSPAVSPYRPGRGAAAGGGGSSS